jgi:hypothetical protein
LLVIFIFIIYAQIEIDLLPVTVSSLLLELLVLISDFLDGFLIGFLWMDNCFANNFLLAVSNEKVKKYKIVD